MDLRSFKKKHDAMLKIYVKRKLQSAQKIAARPRPQQLLAYIDDTIFAG